MNQLHVLYNTMISNKKKERFEIILEPLQALLQLSFLSFCPIGTKLTIQQNLLYVQLPNWHQPVLRIYNNDTKDDVFFLFNVVQRFNRFYGYFKTSQVKEERELYKLLCELGKEGIDNLIQTYGQSDKPALLHTLQMYKTMLDKPEEFEHLTQQQRHYKSHNKVYSSHKQGSKSNTKLDIQQDSAKQEEQNENEQNDEIKTAFFLNNMDDVFIKITEIYTKEEIQIIYYTLYTMKKNPGGFESYINGLNLLLEPKYYTIKTWINDNIVF